MKVLISGRAEDDLAGIYAYIAARNPDAAERFRTEAERALDLLGEGNQQRDFFEFENVFNLDEALDLMVQACGPIPMVDFARAKARFMEENSLDDLLNMP